MAFQNIVLFYRCFVARYNLVYIIGMHLYYCFFLIFSVCVIYGTRYMRKWGSINLTKFILIATD
jgi:hypothetical protein